MKKSLFLSFAALAIAGSVSAQTLDGSGVALASQGVKSYAVTTADLSQTFKLTYGGTYSFEIDRTDWATSIGSAWAGVIKGSRVAISGATEGTKTITDASNIQTTSGTLQTATVALTAPTSGTLGDLTFVETVYDVNDAPGSCNRIITATFALQAVPTIALTDGKNVLCATKDQGITYTSTGAGSSTVKYTLQRLNADGTTTDIYIDKYVALTTSNGSGTFTVQTSDITSVGKYTLTVTEIIDQYLVEASNAAALGTVSASNTATFTLLPSPTPTLKTSAAL
jgi:hypothetical protein